MTKSLVITQKATVNSMAFGKLDEYAEHYGDGWYDGFRAALAKRDDLEDIDDDLVMALSEEAQSVWLDNNAVISELSGAHAFLSNFFPVSVEFEGMTFPSVEHAYVAAKTTSIKSREHIQAMRSPGKAKRYGRHLKLRPDWENIKVRVMEELLRDKFSEDPLRRRLLSTRGYRIEEGNWWNDKFWGVCDGEGQNMLGKLLMKIREEIIQEESNNG